MENFKVLTNGKERQFKDESAALSFFEKEKKQAKKRFFASFKKAIPQKEIVLLLKVLDGKKEILQTLSL